MRVILWLLITTLMGCANDSTTPPSGDRTLAANLVALPTGGTISGTADVRWTVGMEQFVATAAITGDVLGAIRPWHVHFGTCATGGDIVGPAGSYEPLVVGQDGTARMTATVGFELDASAPYHVNVHESQTALATLIACGNLAGSGGGSGGDNGDTGGGGY